MAYINAKDAPHVVAASRAGTMSGRPMATIRSSQIWRCAAPVDNGTCGVILTGWERDPIEGPPEYGFRAFSPGPTIRHLPCGHRWLIGRGFAPSRY